MAIAKENTRVIVTIPKELKEKADKIAEKELRTLSNLIVVALKDYIENYEHD